MTTPIHEKILLEGLKEGNEKIFDYIFHYYYSGLVVFAQKYIPDSDVAKDIVQALFVKLWTNREKLVINSSLKSYLFSSVRNRCIDYLRHEATKGKVEKKLIERLSEISDERNLLVESELRDKINTAMGKLPPVCREVFYLNRFEGLKPAEIAEKKEISVRTVETHIGKALKILRVELAGYLPSSLIALVLGAM